MSKKIKTSKQMIWVRVSYSEYHEIEAETPELALEKIHELDLFKGEDGDVCDHKFEIEEVCTYSQL